MTEDTEQRSESCRMGCTRCTRLAIAGAAGFYDFNDFNDFYDFNDLNESIIRLMDSITHELLLY